VNTLLYFSDQDVHYDTSHVLSRCVFIPNKFPTLLAEREIIANAF